MRENRHHQTRSAFAVLIALTARYLLICAPSGAQEVKPQPIRVGVNLVQVDATVWDQTGQVMSDLKMEDFVLHEEGIEQKIEILSRDQLPLSVALVLDISHSIEPFFKILHDTAATTLATFKPEDEVALFTFSTTVDFPVLLTTDKTKIAKKFGSLTAGGATNLSDALFESAKYLMTVAPKGRRVIVLISDDVGTVPGHHLTHEIVDEILEADATLYNLQIPGDNPEGRGSYVDVYDVAERTGGEVVEVQTKDSLAATFSDLIERVKTRYTLGYYSSVPCARSKEHKLEVSLAPSFGTKGEDYRILARRGYYCSPKTQEGGGYRRVKVIPQARRGASEYEMDSWAGEVAKTDDEARTITLTFTKGNKTDTFTGVLKKGFRVRMSTGVIQELKPSELAPGRWITVLYTEKTGTIDGKKTTYNEISRIDFLN